MDNDLKDPSLMSDEELDAVISNKPTEEEEPKPESQEPEKQEPESNEPEGEQQEPEEKEDPNSEEERQPSRREQLRINDLLKKYGEPTQEPPKPKADSDKTLDYESELEADPETVRRLQEDRERFAQQRYEEGLERANSIQFHTRLEVDAPKVEAKYSFLDKSSDDFNPEAAQAMNLKYLQFVGYDPNSGSVRDAATRYSDFVDAEMQFANAIAQKEIREQAEQITRQASQTGLRPDGAAPKMNLSKLPEDMSDDELDAVIAQAVPPRRR